MGSLRAEVQEGDSIAPGLIMGDEDWQLSKDSADAATANM